VERYRLLNEPSQAQSICEDILRVDPANQDALVMLLLAITDQFGDSGSESDARQILPRLHSEYHRAYYAGIICERSARAVLRSAIPGSFSTAYESLEQAMRWFEKAEAVRPPGNDDSILRWNSCARTLMRSPLLQPRGEERYQEVLGE
ncbi:MAG TPA: hypothetical protein VFL57_17150, partial [Bryobacteraceae bacterium]|nr:hypothetical protein [Bryobacteraceae bacterium]